MNQYTKKQLADAVRTARSQKGYTQQELSDRTGLSLRSIQRIEKEEALPRAYTLRILAAHLGIAEEPEVASHRTRCRRSRVCPTLSIYATSPQQTPQNHSDDRHRHTLDPWWPGVHRPGHPLPRNNL
ncbi:helix-turn-helix domain-containing protein [Fulvivirgaceae bacterium PWU5]|uniref:Helix-turn-helix domain-containing protein n=1 Tax=Dawidia cretensis TaxID=2782350 RepID=A0AAP2E0B2_9BACT|nr:helix-turn-helix domain-containing protein [Dawidia cretensis]